MVKMTVTHCRLDTVDSVKILASTTVSIDHILESMQDNKIVLLTEPLQPSGTILLLASILQPKSGPSGENQYQHSHRNLQFTGMANVKRQKAVHQKIHYHNGHSYVATFFSQPTFCAVDHEFIWGIFGTQGYRCQVGRDVKFFLKEVIFTRNATAQFIRNASISPQLTVLATTIKQRTTTT